MLDLFRRREQNDVQIGIFILEVVLPGDDERRGHKIDLVQNENDVFLLHLGAVFIEFGRKVKRRKPNVHDDQDDIADLKYAPQLTPRLQIHLEIAQLVFFVALKDFYQIVLNKLNIHIINY